MNTDHLVALLTRLSNERTRLNLSKTPAERFAREVIVKGCEKEIAWEYVYLGMDPIMPECNEDDLLADLLS